MRRALFALALLLGAPASAWESTCQRFSNGTAEPSALRNPTACTPAAGPATAQGRWVGPLDEHRRLWEATRAAAGLPEAVSRTQLVRVFTAAGNAPGPGALPSLLPVAFDAAERVRTRAFTVGELAQLPDYSYALWDWAQGHETCPLDGVGADAVACHDFASHMGPVNANHFLPLARDFYRAYHRLALSRAGECAQMKARLAGDAARFTGYLQACELEALTLEAVAQHYLQDGWSMGHMWQRWGGPDLTDFPGATEAERREKAVLVALVSGLVHGARGVLQALPSWTGYDVNDALCAPHDAVTWVQAGVVPQPAVGDDYLGLLPAFGGGSRYAPQWDRLGSCAASGLLQVYAAAGENHGPATPESGLRSVDPEGDACWSQRATNEAMRTAAAVDLSLAGVQWNIRLDARLVSQMMPEVATSSGSVEVSRTTRAQFRLELQRLVTLGRLWAQARPNGTELADGALGPFLGASPNGAYAGRAQLASYLDPPMPWSGTSTSPRTQALARLFHRGHAQDWCDALDAPALEGLKARVAGAPDADTRLAACEACAEFSVRSLRVGTSASDYDASREPLCHGLASTPSYVYWPGTANDEPEALARAWCGC